MVPNLLYKPFHLPELSQKSLKSYLLLIKDYPAIIVDIVFYFNIFYKKTKKVAIFCELEINHYRNPKVANVLCIVTLHNKEFFFFDFYIRSKHVKYKSFKLNSFLS